jgi:uncharacterized coiled-coil DUF342 family protein
MEDKIERKILEMLKERRSVPFIIVACKSTLNHEVSREEIEAINKKHDVEKILKEEMENEISHLVDEVKAAYLEFFELRKLYDRLLAALDGYNSDITKQEALKNFTGIHDRTFAAMNRYLKLEKEAKEQIQNKCGNQGKTLFDSLSKMARQFISDSHGEPRLIPDNEKQTSGSLF